MKQFRYNEYMLFRLPKFKPLGDQTALVRKDDDTLEWKTLEELAQQVITIPEVDFVEYYNQL